MISSSHFSNVKKGIQTVVSSSGCTTLLVHPEPVFPVSTKFKSNFKCPFPKYLFKASTLMLLERRTFFVFYILLEYTVFINLCHQIDKSKWDGRTENKPK